MSAGKIIQIRIPRTNGDIHFLRSGCDHWAENQKNLSAGGNGTAAKHVRQRSCKRTEGGVRDEVAYYQPDITVVASYIAINKRYNATKEV